MLPLLILFYSGQVEGAEVAFPGLPAGWGEVGGRGMSVGEGSRSRDCGQR